MEAIKSLERNLRQIGYPAEAILERYVFSDVLSSSALQQRVALAAFTHTPPSYRNAAFGVLNWQTLYHPDALMPFRALGAPILFCITHDSVEVWQVRSSAPPQKIKQQPLSELDALFQRHAAEWSPSAIQRAKSIGLFDTTYQLDFVDVGLLPAIEGEIHLKLDRLLNELLADSNQIRSQLPRAERVDYPSLFSLTFQLLTAKILFDREHPDTKQWSTANVRSVLAGITRYYGLEESLGVERAIRTGIADASWSRLKEAISFSNISADDLAYVYETTLVTNETRQRLSTHSTPRQVAEYVVNRLRLLETHYEQLRIYEPFAGSAVFLIAAMRHLRERLPPTWDPKQQHAFLVRHITGSEIDQFARQVAQLSLILADYPNANGWKIYPDDLFAAEVLPERLRSNTVVLCNPPFEAFTGEERSNYPEIAQRSVHKPIAILETVLDQPPQYLGFVLPAGFISNNQYQSIRSRLENTYSDIEVVSLPDRVFREASVASSLLIAQHRRTASEQHTKLYSTRVIAADREKFLRYGIVSSRRERTRPYSKAAAGQLWIKELEGVWEYLAQNRRLGEVAEIHRGLEWNYDQSHAWSRQKKRGFRRGFHTIKSSIRQFCFGEPVYLDCNSDSLRGNALAYPWDKPKVIANAVRLSRGPWRIAAVQDNKGLVCSQQFFGVWLRENSSFRLSTLAAILNSPLCNAYIYTHDPERRLRVTTLKTIPLPSSIEQDKLDQLIEQYQHAIAELTGTHTGSSNGKIERLLKLIDAEILRGYDLPPILERELLDTFRSEKRPVAHQFHDYFSTDFIACIPLHEYLGTDFERAKGNWVQEVFKPLSDDELKRIANYLP